jgi:hypothetical protein
VGAPGTAVLLIVTVTPGRTAPDSSLTIPEIVPVVRCASAGNAAPKSSTKHKPDLSQRLIAFSWIER